MKNKEKLIELFKTVPEIKKDIMELKFGTKINYKDINYKYISSYPISDKLGVRTHRFNIIDKNEDMGTIETTTDNFKRKIIGNPLEERHLRIFCKKKGFRCNFQENDIIHLRKGSANEERYGFNGDKSLNNQTEEVLGQIYNFLKEKVGKID